MEKIRHISTAFLTLFLSVFFSACENDDNVINEMNIEYLYGKWELTYADFGGEGKYDDLNYLGWYMEFRRDGSYYGYGFGESGYGTYKVNKWTVTTYVDGDFYLKYEVKALSKDYVSAIIYDADGNNFNIRAKKIKE